MKTKIVIALLVGICGIAAAQTRYQSSWVVTLTTINQVIAPDIDHVTTNEWAASTSYVVGDYVLNSSGRMYFCVAAGSSLANSEPTHRGGAAYKSDNILWYRVPDNRRNITVQLIESGTDAWILEGGYPVVPEYGRLLTGKGMAYVFEDYRGEINGITASGTVKVNVTEN